jgi:hypothetical protein
MYLINYFGDLHIGVVQEMVPAESLIELGGESVI